MPDLPRSKVKVEEEAGGGGQTLAPSLTAVSALSFPGDGGRSRESTIVGDTVQPRYGGKPLTYSFVPRSHGHLVASKVPDTSSRSGAELQSSQRGNPHIFTAPHRPIPPSFADPVPKASFPGPPAVPGPPTFPGPPAIRFTAAMSSAAANSDRENPAGPIQSRTAYRTGTQGTPNTEVFHGFGRDSGHAAGSAPVASLHGRHQPESYYNDGSAPGTSHSAHSAGHHHVIQANAMSSGLGPASGAGEQISRNTGFFTNPNDHSSFDQRFINRAPFSGQNHERNNAPGRGSAAIFADRQPSNQFAAPESFMGSHISNARAHSFAPMGLFSAPDLHNQFEYASDHLADNHAAMARSGYHHPPHEMAQSGMSFDGPQRSSDTQGDRFHAFAPHNDRKPKTTYAASDSMPTVTNPSPSNAKVSDPVSLQPNSANINESSSPNAFTDHHHVKHEAGPEAPTSPLAQEASQHTSQVPISPPTAATEAETLANSPTAPQSPEATYIALVVPPPSPSPDHLPRAHVSAAEAPSDWVPNFAPVMQGNSTVENQGVGAVDGKETAAPSITPVAPSTSTHPSTSAPSSNALGKRPARDDSHGQMSPNKRRKSAPPLSVEAYIIPDDDDDELKIVEDPKNDVAVKDGALEVLDNRGDLILVVGPQKRKFQVCSRALFRASPVMEAAYSTTPGSSSSHDGGPLRKVTIADVDASALHMLLLHIHAKAIEPKYKIDRAIVSKAFIIAHHYDMLASLAAVGRNWLQKTFDKQTVECKDLADQLWITYQLGYLPGVKAMMMKIIPNARLLGNGEMLAHGTAIHNTYDKLETFDILSMMRRPPAPTPHPSPKSQY